MIPQETINKITESANIVDVVGEFVQLKRRGANYTACCPFHNEKTPSFSVSPSRGIYKCFGCGKSGTAVKFVMEHENMTYVEALKFLAKKYGIEIQEKEETAEDIAKRQRSESLYLVTDFAAKFFQESLETEEGRTIGLAYFRQRGLEDETIRKYGLGWAPKSRNKLTKAAQEAGYKEEYLVDTGLCVKHDDGSLADRFFDRVIFPVHSPSGRIIAFGGRTLKTDKSVSKYVNSPETEIYVKSRSLYGIWFAKNEIARQDRCYLVEGYLDVLSMHQLGITNVVASSGTSLTVEQIRLIKKYTSNVNIMYDGDGAGIHAALRGIGMVLKEGMNVKVVLIPDGDDPDSYSRKHTLDEVRDFIAASEQDFINFKAEIVMKEAGDDPLKKAEFINDIADTIALIPDPIKRVVYVQSISQRFSIPEELLHARIRKTRKEEEEKESFHSGSLEKDIVRPGQAPERKIVQKPSAEEKVLFENKILEPAEKDLLWFLLNHGVKGLAFQSESEFYDPEGVWTVADFIRDAIESDNHSFENSIYRKTYDAFFDLYDNDETLKHDDDDPDVEQNDIIRRLMNGPDRDVADMTGNLTQENYNLSVKDFKASMTNINTMLVTNVPKAILVYQSRRIQDQEEKARMRLKQQPDSEAALSDIQKLRQIRLKIEQKIGRISK